MKRDIQSGEILCVGTELLVGQIINTNAAWLARQLSLIGISSYYQTVVGDNPDRVLAAMRQSADRSDVLFVTGGLGPTADDLTMGLAARFVGQAMVLHEPSRQAIAGYFDRMKRSHVTQNNWKQAMLPEQARVLPNHNGTAPGAILEYEFEGKARIMILLPGPPGEMQLMFNESVRPWLMEQTTSRFRHLFVRLIGIGESAAETELLDLIQTQGNPTLAPYASDGEVMFRISQWIRQDDEPDRTADMLAEVRKRMGSYIYEVGERTMPEVVKDLLLAKNQTISFAESCTAGLISSTLGEYPGVSAVFKGSVVSYANEIKQDLLGVSEAILKEQGAVSEACAVAMATGCRNLLHTDLAVAVTGIAGPDGGTAEKPVGLVWIAVVSAQGVRTRKLNLSGNRARIRKVAALNAFDLARRELLA